jgi:hypothetical protein
VTFDSVGVAPFFLGVRSMDFPSGQILPNSLALGVVIFVALLALMAG